MAVAIEPLPMVVIAIPDPAAFKKFLLENFMSEPPHMSSKLDIFAFALSLGINGHILSKQGLVVQP
jgi:hypothetical protein